jgi:hypothetical protein
MYGFDRAPDEVIAGWHEIAEKVRLSLEYAGIAAYLATGEPGRPGAEIEVDPGADDAGGVFVSWVRSGELIRAAVEAVKEGRQESPVVVFSESIARHMRDVMVEVLRLSGFQAVPYDDGLRLPSAKVVSGPAEGASAP